MTTVTVHPGQRGKGVARGAVQPAIRPKEAARGRDDVQHRANRTARAWILAITSGLLITVGAILLLPIGFVTLFRSRRLYSRVARCLSLAILGLYGVRLAVRGALPFPRTQTVYISNHTSTLDLFVLVALGLPNCRFFLSGFLRKIVPLGIISSMMGTFFTVPQDRSVERTRIFQRAERILRRTKESVYLSPEGGRITTGQIGHFNKGAFHLATNLHVPIVPFYLRIPAGVDPRLGYDARPGTVEVVVLPAIDTSAWRVADVRENKERVREVLVRVHDELRNRESGMTTA
jgi:1-acyl-sn-glycerol-3-phosphate acyltransferase